MLNKEIKALVHLLGEDDTRPVLQRVEVSPGKAVATDSYLLGELTYSDDANFEPFLATRDELVATFPEKPPKPQPGCSACEYCEDENCDIVETDIPEAHVIKQAEGWTQITTTHGGRKLTISFGDDKSMKFPQAENLLAGVGATEQTLPTIDPRLLLRLLTAITEAGFTAIKLAVPENPEGPIALTGDNGKGTKGRFLIMPMRTA